MHNDRCPECGRTNIDHKWHHGSEFWCNETESHVHYYCECGYNWIEKKTDIFVKLTIPEELGIEIYERG